MAGCLMAFHSSCEGLVDDFSVTTVIAGGGSPPGVVEGHPSYPPMVLGVMGEGSLARELLPLFWSSLLLLLSLLPLSSLQ